MIAAPRSGWFVSDSTMRRQHWYCPGDPAPLCASRANPLDGPVSADPLRPVVLARRIKRYRPCKRCVSLLNKLLLRARAA